MAARLRFIARGRRGLPLPPAKLKMLQQWIDEDWESHDVDDDLVQLLQRLLHTINKRPRRTPWP